MDQSVKECILHAVKKEPFAQALNMKVVELKEGFSAVERFLHPALYHQPDRYVCV